MKKAQGGKTCCLIQLCIDKIYDKIKSNLISCFKTDKTISFKNATCFVKGRWHTRVYSHYFCRWFFVWGVQLGLFEQYSFI